MAQLVRKSPLELAGSIIKPDSIYKDFSKEGAEYQATLQKKPLGYVEEGHYGPTRTSYYPGKRGVALPKQWSYKTPDDLIRAQKLNDAHRSALVDRYKAIPENERNAIDLEIGTALDPFDFDLENALERPYTQEETIDWIKNYAYDEDFDTISEVLKKHNY